MLPNPTYTFQSSFGVSRPRHIAAPDHNSVVKKTGDSQYEFDLQNPHIEDNLDVLKIK